jgi:amino acid transporter
MPIAILGSLFVATVLYILVALAATGALPFKELEGSEAPLADVLDKAVGTTIAELVNIGTLFAFFLVNIGVMILRRTRPDLDRGFKVPVVWLCAPIGAALCIYLMAEQPFDTWMRFFGWMAIGLVIYFFYGRKHSKLRQGLAGREAASPANERFGRG